MIKISSPTDWDFGQRTILPIKVSSRGLIGNDRSQLIKTAGEDLVRCFDNVKIARGEEPLLVLALGERDTWGANRNGDGFTQDMCRAFHDTFQKHARWYRWHDNKPTSDSYGLVKASMFNEPMQRIDLIVALNATKEAAERNKGFLADKEMEKIAKGEDIPVSMACTIPYDQCSACGNKARSQADYCTSATCKAGGCKDNLGKLVKLGSDVHHLHVTNHNPRWFDISFVGRPADRTAYAGRADWFSKTAADLLLPRPQDIVVPIDVMMLQLSDGCNRQVQELVKLACMIHQLDEKNLGSIDRDVLRAFQSRQQVDLTFLGRPGTKQAAEGLAALAEYKIILPLSEFARWTSRGDQVKNATALLPGVYGRMIADGSLSSQIAASQFAPAMIGEMSQRRAAFRIKAAYSLDEYEVRHRCWQSCVRREDAPVFTRSDRLVKRAEDVCMNPDTEQLARDYAVYQLTALYKIAEDGGDLVLTTRLSMSQNHI